MDLLTLLVLLVIAGICGSIAELLVGFSPGGFMVSIVIGVVGAYLGSFLAHQFGLPNILSITVGPEPFDLVYATLGSIILLAVISLLRGGRGRRFARRRRF
ncbi:MAG: GlsB/YeaQ/YmgE family stress response membrane protein [Herpetosiphonaceae bacterium]|nr:GlsB/YeaQ/YmgE family stress response membrane protein [Herpetosiphonaceae bacterium]